MSHLALSGREEGGRGRGKREATLERSRTLADLPAGSQQETLQCMHATQRRGGITDRAHVRHAIHVCESVNVDDPFREIEDSR